MKNLILLLFFLIIGSQLHGQNSIKKILLENQNVDGKMLEIIHNKSTTPINVILVWLREDEQKGQQFLTLQPGKNNIILESNPLWSGHIKGLGSTDPSITARLIDITFMAQASQLFNAFKLTPGSINFAPQNFLFGYSMRYPLIAVALLLSIAAIFLKVNWRHALYIGFVSSGLILACLQVYQEYTILKSYKANNNTLQPFTSLVPFVDAAAPILENQPWSKTKLSGVHNSYVKYQFAEEEMIPLNSAAINGLLITDKPREKEVLLNINGFYLTRK